MPNRTIYIRKSDLELWDKLEDKAEKVSQMLNKSHVEAPRTHENKKDESTPIPEPKIVNKYESRVICKHGYDPYFCKFSKV